LELWPGFISTILVQSLTITHAKIELVLTPSSAFLILRKVMMHSRWFVVMKARVKATRG
jgi:hypothetical protein